MSTTKATATPSAAEPAKDSSAPASPLSMGLGQQLGNQYLQTLLQARMMQAKLTVSHPQDAFEHEADRVADQIMRMPAPSLSHTASVGTIRRLPEGERELRRSSASAMDVPTVDAATEHSIQSLSGRGSALPKSMRSFMEPRFNADFSAVRVHTGAHADQLARSVNAQAFTVGRDVVFGAGRYSPDTEGGKRLLAHELTHVVQQSPASVTSPTRIQRQPASAETQTAPAPPQIDGAAKRIGFVRFHSGEQYLNLYSAPDELSKVVDVLEFGQRVHRVEGSNSTLDGARAGEAVARRPDRTTRWLKVVVLGQTGYVDESRIHFPPPDLIQKDPGLRLIRVRPGLTFYGLVHDVYGIKGNESTKDLNLNHFINAIRAVNKEGAFEMKTGVLERPGNFLLSGRDAKNTRLKENFDLWIPSIGVATKMDVGSGTFRGEFVRIEKKIEQILQDFKDASLMSGDYIFDAVKSRAGEVGMGLISGLVDFAKDALKIMAAATAAGAVIGAILGAGAGAVPGMEIGFEIGLLILEVYGVYFLVDTVLSMAGALVSQLGRFIALVLEAKGDKKQLDLAARALADALGILASAMLMAIAAYVLKKGSEGIMKTKFAQTVGRTRLGEWIKDRQRLKTTDEGVSAAAEKARENTRAREAERARDAAPPGQTWVKTGDGVEVLVPKSSSGSSRGTTVDPARFKKGLSVPKQPTVIDLEVDGNAARVPGGSPKGGALQVVPRTSPPATRVNVGSFNPVRNATVGAGLERTRSGAVAEAGKAIDKTGRMTARGDVTSASAPGVPRHIPPSLPTPAAPGTFVPGEPRLLPPDRQVGGLGRDTKFVLPDHVPPPERSRRVGGFGRESEPPVPHNPNAPPSTSPPVPGFARDRQRLQWGAEVPELPVEKLRRVGGFGRKGEPAVPHDPFGPRFLRDPKENQPIHVDGFARGLGAQAPADDPDFVIDLQALRLGPDTAHGEFDGKDFGSGPAPDQQTIIVDDSWHRDGSNVDTESARPPAEAGKGLPPSDGDLTWREYARNGTRPVVDQRAVKSVDGPEYCGPACAAMLLQELGWWPNIETLAKSLGTGADGNTGMTAPNLAAALRAHGLPSARAAIASQWELERALQGGRYPAIAIVREPGKSLFHWVIVDGFTTRPWYGHVLVAIRDPWGGSQYFVTGLDFVRRFSGQVVLTDPLVTAPSSGPTTPTSPKERPTATSPGSRQGSPPPSHPEGASDSRTQRTATDPVDGQAPRTGTDLAMLNRARSSIRAKLLEMLDNNKVVETFTVEQVKFGAVTIKLVKDVLYFSFFEIRKDISAPKGHGKLILQEFERAVMDVARTKRARRVRGDLYVVNSRLAEDLTKRVSRPWKVDEKTKGGSTSQAGDDRKLGGDKKTEGESAPQRLFLEIELPGSSGGGMVGGGPPRRSAPPPAPSKAVPESIGDGGRGEPLNPDARTGGRNSKPTRPYPTKRKIGAFNIADQTWDEGDAVQWHVWNWSREGGPMQNMGDIGAIKEFIDYIKQFKALAANRGFKTVQLTVHNIETESVQRSARPEATLWPSLGGTARRIDANTIEVDFALAPSAGEVVANESMGAVPVPVGNAEKTTRGSTAPVPTLANTGHIPTKGEKPFKANGNALDHVVEQARKEVADGLEKQNARGGSARGEEHLSPECMSGACNRGRRAVARELKKLGYDETKIFMNQVSDIAGHGAHTFTVLEIPSGYVLIDTTFAQFTGTLHGAPRVGELTLQKSGKKGAYIRKELLEKGYLVLNDEIANVYVKVASELDRGTYKVSDLVRAKASLAQNPGLLVGL